MMLLGERGSVGRWIANAMGIGGCSLILGINSEEIGFDHTDWFGFLSALPGQLAVSACGVFRKLILSTRP